MLSALVLTICSQLEAEEVMGVMGVGSELPQQDEQLL